MSARCHTGASRRLRELVRAEIARLGSTISPRKIVIKPNWVLHATDDAFPIEALVTDARLVEAVVEACLAQFPDASITVCDVPLQYSDFALMKKQCGLDGVIERLTSERVTFRDLRREVMTRDESSFLRPVAGDHGDPRGYRLVQLGSRSHLEPIAEDSKRFAVNDYRGTVTRSNHASGHHNYLISQTVLDCDLFINVPKWKSHQKSALTGALKNVVGISGDKAFLPHFRRGAPRWGGDEYRDEHRWMYLVQTRLREALQKRSSTAFELLKPGWELFKRLRGLETRMDKPVAAGREFYIAGGAWFGNDTIWRMIYDLNLIIETADAEGVCRPRAQRRYFCIVDGLVCGEGNGPLQPLPRPTDWIVTGDDPFEIDATRAWFMGFDPELVPIIARRQEYLGAWGRFALDDLDVSVDAEQMPLTRSAINLEFVPPPGWRDHVERRPPP